MLAPGGAGRRASEWGGCTDPYLSRGAALQAWMNCTPGKSPHLGTCPYAELAFPGPQGLQGAGRHFAKNSFAAPHPSTHPKTGLQPLSPPFHFPHPTLVTPDCPINPETEPLSRAYPVWDDIGPC